MTECGRFDELKSKLMSTVAELTYEELNFLEWHECCPLHVYKDPMEEVKYSDRMNDPRTAPIAYRFAVRMHRELAKVGKKRPAHEVILGMLEDCVKELEKYGDKHAAARASILYRVMEEMIIPEKHRDRIIEYLRWLLNRCAEVEEKFIPYPTGFTDTGNALRALIRKLEDEDAAKAADASQ